MTVAEQKLKTYIFIDSLFFIEPAPKYQDDGRMTTPASWLGSPIPGPLPSQVALLQSDLAKAG
jgi:hypothetical protein